MLRARKKLRLRRPSSPCAVQYALQETLQTLQGLIAYRWWLRYERRGIPRLQVVVLLGHRVTADQILDQIREYCDYEEVGVIVTISTDAFVSICAVDYDDDDDDDDAEAYHSIQQQNFNSHDHVCLINEPHIGMLRY
jgi:hypothetical protein